MTAKGKPLARAKPVVKPSRVYVPTSDVEWNYTFLVGGAAGIVFLARFLTDGPLAAFGFLIPAAIGYYFRWRKMPALAVASLAYFLAVPNFVPAIGPETRLIRLGHFDLMNLILAFAATVYLVAQYRLYGLSQRAMPPDKPDEKRTGADPHLRKIGAIPRGEWVRLFVVLGVCVVAAEFVWLGVTELYVEPSQTWPIRPAGPVGSEASGLPGSPPPAISRLILTIVPIAAVFAVCGFAFWYWRLARLTPAEGTAIVADTGWAEIRREQLRNETFRARALARMKRDTP